MSNLLVRRLSTEDRAAIERHFLRLDPPARRRRFGAGVEEESIADFVQSLDFERDHFVGAVGRDGELLAVSELHFSGGDEAELALSVEEKWRGKGIGTGLATHLLHVARKRGVKVINLVCGSDHGAMQRIARHLNGQKNLDGSCQNSRIIVQQTPEPQEEDAPLDEVAVMPPPVFTKDQAPITSSLA